MPLARSAAACTRTATIARDVVEFALAKPAGFAFQAGQYVLFDVPLVEHPADVQPRAFSIASAPFEEELLFLAKLIPGGRASRFIAEALSVGTEISMQGPLGRFVLDRATEKNYVFVATSSGLAPFRPMILAALQAGDRRGMDLIFGVRGEEDLFWMDTFERLARKHPNLRVHPVLSAPSSGWKGMRGRVQPAIPEIVTDFSQVSLYACGNPGMTAEVKKLALERWGMAKQDVHVEGYV